MRNCLMLQNQAVLADVELGMSGRKLKIEVTRTGIEKTETRENDVIACEAY